ncbi:MAG: hypothetical protein K2I42_02220 [Anaeroplasmataceae bacterium]|nr:hypothetical protein [Anaeroplasmataceae bacterium]
MYYMNQNFNFNNEVIEGSNIHTTFQGKELILKSMYKYKGPITMQYLPYGGIQSVFGGHIILNTVSGFMATDHVIYDGVEYRSTEFIEHFENLVNEVLPS